MSRPGTSRVSLYDEDPGDIFNDNPLNSVDFELREAFGKPPIPEAKSAVSIVEEITRPTKVAKVETLGGSADRGVTAVRFGFHELPDKTFSKDILDNIDVDITALRNVVRMLMYNEYSTDASLQQTVEDFVQKIRSHVLGVMDRLHLVTYTSFLNNDLVDKILQGNVNRLSMLTPHELTTIETLCRAWCEKHFPTYRFASLLKGTLGHKTYEELLEVDFCSIIMKNGLDIIQRDIYDTSAYDKYVDLVFENVGPLQQAELGENQFVEVLKGDKDFELNGCTNDGIDNLVAVLKHVLETNALSHDFLRDRRGEIADIKTKVSAYMQNKIPVYKYLINFFSPRSPKVTQKAKKLLELIHPLTILDLRDPVKSFPYVASKLLYSSTLAAYEFLQRYLMEVQKVDPSKKSVVRRIFQEYIDPDTGEITLDIFLNRANNEMKQMQTIHYELVGLVSAFMIHAHAQKEPAIRTVVKMENVQGRKNELLYKLHLLGV